MLIIIIGIRPFGALLFGWIGDKYGRKPTVVITTILMACSCAIMAGLPTYAQIGIAATWIVTACRVIQGMSSLGRTFAELCQYRISYFKIQPIREENI